MTKGYEEKDLPPPYTPTPTSHDYAPPDHDPVNTQNYQRGPQQPRPYSAENDASSSNSSRGSTVGQIGQTAFGFISSIINSRLEHRQQRFEKRQMRRERRNTRKGKARETQCNNGSNSYDRNMQTRSMDGGRPTWFNDEKNTPSSYCSNNTRGMHQQVNDEESSDSESTEDLGNTAEKLEIKRKNMPFEFKENWYGKECNISTSNGNLVIRGTLEAKDSISLKCSNGAMTIDGDLVARNSISAEGSNGPVLPRGQSIMSKNISIKASNAPLEFNTMIQGEYVKLKTSNAPIILTNLTAFSELNVKSSNAPIELHIDDLGPKAQVTIETSMSPVNIYMPRNFAGEFSIKTSLATAQVVSKSEGTDVTITQDEGTCIKGVCTKYGQKGNARITIKTSMAHATLYL
ncbi:hypothetical protein K501DRAFT_243428 [Backusella circina FSU 941]|nr:hypothetical protein K501DRAFT_243428 [Backusella circina FSU 941]